MCYAHQQQVIINIGFKKFDVLTDANAQTSKCPVCLQYVVPKTCALITAYGGDGELRSHKVVYHRLKFLRATGTKLMIAMIVLTNNVVDL
jgi:hypothetical protein